MKVPTEALINIRYEERHFGEVVFPKSFFEKETSPKKVKSVPDTSVSQSLCCLSVFSPFVTFVVKNTYWYILFSGEVHQSPVAQHRYTCVHIVYTPHIKILSQC